MHGGGSGCPEANHVFPLAWRLVSLRVQYFLFDPMTLSIDVEVIYG